MLLIQADKVNALFLAEAGHQPVAGFRQTGLPAIAGNAFEGMAGGIEIAAYEAGASVFANGGNHPGTAGCGIGPRQGRIRDLGEIGRGHGIADRGVIRHCLRGLLIGNGCGGQGFINLLSAKQIEADATGQHGKHARSCGNFHD